MIEHRSFQIALPHAALHGELTVSGRNQGMVVFVAPRDCAALAAAGDAAAELHKCGIGTVVIDLLLDSEAHFTDADTHLPHLTERLLAVLNYLHRAVETEAIAEQAIGLLAAGAATPLAVRVAALRDNEVRAVACHGGLVDLAGLQYLKVLRAPLLLIADDTDEIAASNLHRAIVHIPAVVSLERLAALDDNAAAAVTLTVKWFQRYLRSN